MEEEVKKKLKFKNEYEKLILNIQLTNSWINSCLLRKLKPFGLTPNQYYILKILNEVFPNSYSNNDIICRMINQSSNSSRIIDKLFLKKLASRDENKTDRRLVEIKITEKGVDLIKKIDASGNNNSLSIQRRGFFTLFFEKFLFFIPSLKVAFVT